MKALSLTGRILFAAPFIVFALGHFGPSAEHMAGMVPVPGGIFWIYFTGLALLAAGVSIATGKLVKLSGILLAVLLLTFALTIFLPGLGAADAQMKQMAFIGLLKDTSLAGAALFISGTLGFENKKAVA